MCVCVCVLRVCGILSLLHKQYQGLFLIVAVQIQVETRRKSIMWEFEKYQRLLKNQPPDRQLEMEAATALTSLEQEERETRQKLELNHDVLIQQSRILCRLIAELEERSQRPVRWMLQVSGSRIRPPTLISASAHSSPTPGWLDDLAHCRRIGGVVLRQLWHHTSPSPLARELRWSLESASPAQPALLPSQRLLPSASAHLLSSLALHLPYP